MSIYAVVRETMRITDPAIEKPVRTPLAYSEGLAHFFGVAILNAAGTGNESLSGYTVSAHFIRGDGYYGAITGTVDGSVAYVILPSWCYRATGRFTLTVYLNSGSGSSATTRCIMIAHGRVIADTTNSMVDPDHVVPDLAALIAQMQQISAAIAKINGLTVSVSTLSPGSSATAALTTVSDHYNLALGIPKGDKGDPGNVSSVNGISPTAQGNVTLPTDSAPTANSGNYVTSGGVKSALDSRDSSITALENAIAIMANGDTHAAIAAWQYVYVRNHGTLSEGLYQANSNIAQNGTLSSSNLTSVSGGGMNALSNKMNGLGAQQDLSANVAAASGVTINNFYMTRVNNIIIFYFILTLASEKTAGSVLVQGLPVYLNLNNMTGRIMKGDGTNATAGCFVDNFGSSIGVAIAASDQLSTGNWRGSIVCIGHQ